MIVGSCWEVDSNCILQHRHRGCCTFVGGSGPESLKFLSELPRLTLTMAKLLLVMFSLVVIHSSVGFPYPVEKEDTTYNGRPLPAKISQVG